MLLEYLLIRFISMERNIPVQSYYPLMNMFYLMYGFFYSLKCVKLNTF